MNAPLFPASIETDMHAQNLKLNTGLDFNLNISWDDSLESILADEDVASESGQGSSSKTRLRSEVAVLEFAVEIEPKNASAWGRLAELAMMHGEFSSALKYCINAVSSNHLDADAWCALAECLERAHGSGEIRGSVLRLRKDVVLTPLVCARAALRRAPQSQRALGVLSRASSQ